MRVALRATGEVGIRAGRILLAERDLEALGSLGGLTASDPRCRPAGDLAGWDVLVSDSSDGADVAAARRAGIPVVLPSDRRPSRRLIGDGSDGPTVLAGCNLRLGIAPSLFTYAAGRAGEVLEVVVGWTPQGKPLRRGKPLPFPEPLGPLWGKPAGRPDWSDRDTELLAAPVEGAWAGTVARVTTVTEEGVAVRTVGLADGRSHLEAIALAAGALALLRGAYSEGFHWAWEGAVTYLEMAMAIGLEVASYAEYAGVATSGER